MLGYMFRQSSMLSLCFKISKIVIYLMTIYIYIYIHIRGLEL